MLSLAMIVKNESQHIVSCLESVKGFVDEMVVVDTGSSDNTKALALSCGARVLDYTWNDHFSDARNYAISQCTGDWVLILDADEYIVHFDQAAILAFMANGQAIGRIRSIARFNQDGEVKELQSIISRLLPRSVNYEGRIHEQVHSTLPRVLVPIHINHNGYYFKDKSNRNFKLLHMAMEENPKDAFLHYEMARQYALLKEYDKAQEYFENSYLKMTSSDQGYKPQLVVDYLYTTLSLRNFAKALELINGEEQLLTEIADFHFVCGLLYMELVFSDVEKYIGFFPRIEKSYLRCLELGNSNQYDSVIGTGSFLAAYNLAVFYETTGDLVKARKYYELSALDKYIPSMDRLNKL